MPAAKSLDRSAISAVIASFAPGGCRPLWMKLDPDKVPLILSFSPRGEGTPELSAEECSSVLSPLGERDRVRAASAGFLPRRRQRDLYYCGRFSFLAERRPAEAVSFSHIYAPRFVCP
jgi:hypothetical protein